MKTLFRLIVSAAVVLVSSVAFAQFSGGHFMPPSQCYSNRPPRLLPQFGDPLRGLTADQLADFAEGLDQFEEIQSVESGLGPIFNNVSCVSCHSGPATGGASAILETRFGRTVNGLFDPLAELGGSLLQLSAIDPECQEIVPIEASVTAQRQTTPIFGMGLIE